MIGQFIPVFDFFSFIISKTTKPLDLRVIFSDNFTSFKTGSYAHCFRIWEALPSQTKKDGAVG